MPCATPICAATATRRLTIAGRLTAGARADVALKPGEAIRIFTGAAMPEGADTVFMQEDVTVEGDQVVVPKGLKLGSNRRLAGEDVPAGQVALPAGTVLEPQHIALAAALGITEIEVRRRLKVAIFSTGDEVVEPGSKRGGAAIYDANRYLLSELLERLGARGDRSRHSARRSGGAGARARQGRGLARSGHYLGRRLDRRGRPRARRGRAHRQPGVLARRHQARTAGGHGRDPRGAAQGHAANSGAAFVGLPGNPVAVFVTFVRVVRPLLRRLAGARPQSLLPLPVRAAFAYKKKKDRREYVRVALRRGADGELEAVKHPQDGAGILTSLTETDGLLEFPEDVTSIEPGARVGFLSLCGADRVKLRRPSARSTRW